MIRRDFIKLSSLFAGEVFISNVLHGCVNNLDKGPELFSFVQINDTHINISGNYEYPKVIEKLTSVIKSINNELKFPLPDFVLFVGDIIHGTKLKVLYAECIFAKRVLDKLRCSYYTVVGNHEVLNTENNPRFLNAYKRSFGEDKVNYSFLHKGFHFIVFNNSSGLGSRQKNKQRNQWLEKTINESCSYPKIIVCHIPLVSFRDDEALGRSFKYWTYKLRGDDTWDIIQAHSDKVVAVLNGHLHLTGVVKTNNNWLSLFFPEKDDIYHISPSGLASYPCHYAHYKVFKNVIEVKMYQTDKSLVTPSSNIHGKYNHGIDYIDSKHLTPESYVSGNKNENSFSIPYKGKW